MTTQITVPTYFLGNDELITLLKRGREMRTQNIKDGETPCPRLAVFIYEAQSELTKRMSTVSIVKNYHQSTAFTI